MRGHSLLKLDSKPGQRSLPIPDRHRPLLADVIQGQVEQFQQRIVTGKRSPVLRNLAQSHVHRLNGVSRVNDLAYLRQILKERRDTRPIRPP